MEEEQEEEEKEEKEEKESPFLGQSRVASFCCTSVFGASTQPEASGNRCVPQQRPFENSSTVTVPSVTYPPFKNG